MKQLFKKYFIPHKENNFHPHILHTKRAVFYSLVFLLTKVIMVVFVIMLPMGAFVLPDVLAEEQRQIVELTNKARAEKNLPPLTISTKLDISAQNKADDMAIGQYFAHTKDQKSLATWLRGANYSYEFAGENLAVGFSTAQGIVQAWKNSPTHYANLVDTDFKELGVGLSGGVYNGKATVFIAQHLATPLVPAVTTPAKVSLRKSSTTQVPENKIPATVAAEPAKSTATVLSDKIESAQENELPVMSVDEPTPVDKYIQAKSVLWPLTNIFAVSQNIYFAAMVFFAVVLLLSIIINIRKQRYHIIAQTSGLIALLFIFWKF
mgnify:CR=1 FL=1